MRHGIDRLLLIVVIGNGTLVVPVDFTVRRPAPKGLGRPGRDKLSWLQVMLERTWAALSAVAHASRCGRSLVWDSGLMAHVANAQHGTLLVEGKTSHVFDLPDGRWVKGQDLLTRSDWPWWESPHRPGVRYARLTVLSPTYKPVTMVVAPLGRDHYYLFRQETPLSAPRLIRAWGRPHWIEHYFRLLKHLLATDGCQVQGEAAYYGYLGCGCWLGWCCSMGPVGCVKPK